VSELEILNGVSKRAFVRNRVWDGLGVSVETARNSLEVLDLSGLNWDVESREVVIGGINYPKYRGNVHAGTNELFGIVTNDYTVVQNRDAFAFTDLLIGEGVQYVTAGYFNGGRRAWILAKLPDDYHLLGDITEPYVVFSNGHDGRTALVVALTPVRVICLNTLNLALETAQRSWSLKHIGDMSMKLDQARQTLGLANRYYLRLSEKAEQLAEKRIDIDEMVDKLLVIPDGVSQRVEDTINLSKDWIKRQASVEDLRPYWNTAWAFVNAVSDVTTHLEPARKTANWREMRLMKTFDGLPLLDKAYALVNAA
jgi:phage/plasmid-like protein (TIGR03299 family)